MNQTESPQKATFHLSIRTLLSAGAAIAIGAAFSPVSVGATGAAGARGAATSAKAGAACKKAQSGVVRAGLTCRRSGTTYRWTATVAKGSTTTVAVGKAPNSTKSESTVEPAFDAELVAQLVSGWPKGAPYPKGAKEISIDNAPLQYVFLYSKGFNPVAIWTAWAKSVGTTRVDISGTGEFATTNLEVQGPKLVPHVRAFVAASSDGVRVNFMG